MLRALLAAALATLAFAAPAQAGGGRYTIDGGTPVEQAQVKMALDASSFNWSQVPETVSIHILPGTGDLGLGEGGSSALPGEIMLDADTLDWGPFAWGVVQHEYAHQVDFFLLTEAQRAEATKLLGGDRWAFDGTFAHEQYTAERFASMLAWTFWTSPVSAEGPHYDRDTLMAGADTHAFQAMLARWGLAQAPAPVCRLVKVKRGHWVWVRMRGRRVHRWARPEYGKVCTN